MWTETCAVLRILPMRREAVPVQGSLGVRQGDQRRAIVKSSCDKGMDMCTSSSRSNQGRTGTENWPGQFLTTTLPAQPNFHSTGPTLAKSKQSPALQIKITLFITLQPCRPTAHCPNTSMATLP